MNYPSFDLSGKTALVTGAARGIGKACALALANAGCDIALGLRDSNSAPELVKEIESMGRDVLPLQMDVSDLDQIHHAVAEAIDHFGRIDILVNNVGLAPGNLPENVTEEDFDTILNLNVKGLFFTTQEVGRHMIQHKNGAIVNISSQAGFVSLPEESIYCMSKAAVNHLTKCLAVEWAPHNIRVNAVAPTFIETPGTDPYLAVPDNKKAVLANIPLGRIGHVHEVSGAVIFLASSSASMITGEVMLIDGGWTSK